MEKEEQKSVGCLPWKDNPILDNESRVRRIAEANSLVDAYSRLSTSAQKLFYVLVSEIPMGASEFDNFHFDKHFLGGELYRGQSHNDIVQNLIEASKELLQAVVFVPKNVGRGSSKIEGEYWTLVNKFSYDNGVFTYRISDDMKSFLLNLKGNFSNVDRAIILDLRNVYSMRLFHSFISKFNLIAAKYKLSKEQYLEATLPIEMEVQVLHDMFFYKSKEYSSYGNLNSRVIRPAIEEIQSKGLLNIEASPKKAGHKVVSITFMVSIGDVLKARTNGQPKVIGQSKKEVKAPKQENPKDDKITDFFSRAFNISKKVILGLEREYSDVELKASAVSMNRTYIEEQAEIKSPVAVLKSCLKNRYYEKFADLADDNDICRSFDEMTADKKEPTEVSPVSSEQRAAATKICGQYDIPQSFIDKYGYDAILYGVRYGLSQNEKSPKANLNGYIKKSIENGYYVPYMEDMKEKEVLQKAQMEKDRLNREMEEGMDKVQTAFAKRGKDFSFMKAFEDNHVF